MHFPTRFSERLRALREERGLTQGALAARAGLTTTRVCDFERSFRVPLPDQVAALETALGEPRVSLTNGTDWLTPEERISLRAVSARQRRRFYREHRYRPPRDREMHVQLKKAMAKYPNVTRELLGVISRRDDASLVARLLCEMVAGSSLEAVVHLTLLALGAVIVLLAPESTGFSQHPIIDPATREGVGGREVMAYSITLDGMPCLLIPQVGLACRKSTWCVDFLCAVIDDRRVVHWFYLEIDGEGHDYTSDAFRTADIAMPVVRLKQSAILSGDAGQAIADGIRAALPGRRLAA